MAEMPNRGRPLVVVSNREPFLHLRRADGSIAALATAGGVSVALDSLMQERGGTWIAHGAGDADAEVVDAHDRVRVPPEAPAYTLRRIWLTPDEEKRYYTGFANEGLWPLAHIAHVRPRFRDDDWTAYQRVNRRFAEAVAAELAGSGTPVFIQDYHLALVAGELRRLEPGVRTALFWHIPWPDPDRLRICPWRLDLMKGLLANDLLAFQLERDLRNFVSGMRDELELDASIEEDRITLDGHTTRLMAAPIGVDFDRIQRIGQDPALDGEVARLFREQRLDDPEIEVIGVGVDRLDYTKGILERLDALDHLLTSRPDLRKKLVFVQVGVPSRSQIGSYMALEKQIDERVAALNVKHGRGAGEGPIRYHKAALEMRRLVALYRLADFCIVSSLHDGMNLVAKEFVASRDDLGGVLVLSEMTGAAQELTDALMINPYHVESFAQAIERAIYMPGAERARRMRSLRRVVAGHDVFQWASDILDRLEELPADEAVMSPFRAALPGGSRLRHRLSHTASNVRG
jgi:trehalose 6-phosphate synthase